MPYYLVAKSPEVRAKMGQAGRRRAQEFYDWRVKAKALLKIYEDVVSDHIMNSKSAGT